MDGCTNTLPPSASRPGLLGFAAFFGVLSGGSAHDRPLLPTGGRAWRVHTRGHDRVWSSSQPGDAGARGRDRRHRGQCAIVLQCGCRGASSSSTACQEWAAITRMVAVRAAGNSCLAGRCCSGSRARSHPGRPLPFLASLRSLFNEEEFHWMGLLSMAGFCSWPSRWRSRWRTPRSSSPARGPDHVPARPHGDAAWGRFLTLLRAHR